MSYTAVKYLSPVGTLTLIGSAAGLATILWEKDKPNRTKISTGREDKSLPILKSAMNQLDAYFSGKLKDFEMIFDLQGTEFQKKVWAALLKIKYGQTKSYLDIAKAIKQPTAVRAVGTAIGRNPLSIIIPCHRVIGSDGSLTGFAGGLDIKAYLLNLEK